MQYCFLVFIVFFTALSYAEANLPSHCRSSAVREINVPIDPVKRSGSFTYRYGYSEREDPLAPLIIFIPGGPGQTSMDMALGYPSEFAVVRTDPRGVGCNENSLIQVKDMSSETIAHDILGIIKDLNPKKYFIHGISYGTIVTTIVAAKAREHNLPLPEAVILEGTIGRPYLPDEYLNGTLERWKEVKKDLPPAVIRSIIKPPFQLSSKAFAAWLSAIMIYGKLPVGTDYAKDELMLLDPSGDQELRDGLLLRMKKMSSAPSLSKILHYKEIACREFVPDVRDVKYDFDWNRGNLISTKSRLCRGVKFDRPFYSRAYQVQVPIYYFRGDLDPVTPLAQLEHHRQNQDGPHTLVTVKGGGHTALSTNLSDCFPDIWNALLLKDDQKLIDTMEKNCALAVEVFHGRK